MNEEKKGIISEQEQVMKDHTIMLVRLDEIETKLDLLLAHREVQTSIMQGAASIPNQIPHNRPKRWPAVCMDCGQNCLIPFKPYPGSPIRCPDCYQRSVGGY